LNFKEKYLLKCYFCLVSFYSIFVYHCFILSCFILPARIPLRVIHVRVLTISSYVVLKFEIESKLGKNAVNKSLNSL